MCQAEKGPELTAPAAPEASEPETELLAEAKAADLFLDRELSWLQFNRRVLEQAGDPTVPLLERLKFLGIYRSNLEEFFMVRVGSLTHRAALLPDERDEKTGCTPGEQVSAILAAVAAQQPREERIYRRLLEDMRDAGIDVLDFHKMTKPEEVVAKKYSLSCARSSRRALWTGDIRSRSSPTVRYMWRRRSARATISGSALFRCCGSRRGASWSWTDGRR